MAPRCIGSEGEGDRLIEACHNGASPPARAHKLPRASATASAPRGEERSDVSWPAFLLRRVRFGEIKCAANRSPCRPSPPPMPTPSPADIAGPAPTRPGPRLGLPAAASAFCRASRSAPRYRAPCRGLPVGEAEAAAESACARAADAGAAHAEAEAASAGAGAADDDCCDARGGSTPAGSCGRRTGGSAGSSGRRATGSPGLRQAECKAAEAP